MVLRIGQRPACPAPGFGMNSWLNVRRRVDAEHYQLMAMITSGGG
jgi:hypothetical protein